MDTISTAQYRKLFELLDQKNVSGQKFQALFTSGLFSDLLDGNIEKVKRDDYRHMLGLSCLSVLTSRTTHDIGSLDDTLDLDVFYKTRSGLDVWENFSSAIIAKAKVSKKKLILTKVYSRDLTSDSFDKVIEKDVGKNHHFEELEVALLIAKMIQKQEGGVAGSLLNYGRVNLFYTASWVVYVYWVTGIRKWRLGTYRRGDIRWVAGLRVFSRN